MEQLCPSPIPVFDKKFKIVIKTKYSDDYFDRLEWVNNNSACSVDVRICNSVHSIMEDDIYFAFESSDDAIIFKIKYSL